MQTHTKCEVTEVADAGQKEFNRKVELSFSGKPTRSQRIAFNKVLKSRRLSRRQAPINELYQEFSRSKYSPHVGKKQLEKFSYDK
jgi:hypothetical protein